MQFFQLPAFLLFGMATADLMQTYYWAGAASPPGTDGPFTIDWQYKDGKWHRGVGAAYNVCSTKTGVWNQEYLCVETNWIARFKFKGEGQRCLQKGGCGGTMCGTRACTVCTWTEVKCF